MSSDEDSSSSEDVASIPQKKALQVFEKHFVKAQKQNEEEKKEGIRVVPPKSANPQTPHQQLKERAENFKKIIKEDMPNDKPYLGMFDHLIPKQ